MQSPRFHSPKLICALLYVVYLTRFGLELNTANGSGDSWAFICKPPKIPSPVASVQGVQTNLTFLPLANLGFPSFHQDFTAINSAAALGGIETKACDGQMYFALSDEILKKV